MSCRFLPACRFVPTASRLIGQSSIPVSVPAPQREYLVAIGRGVNSVLIINSHRHYIRGVDRSVGRPRNDREYDPDAIVLNKKINRLGKFGRWNEILLLVEKENHKMNNVNWSTAFSKLGKIKSLDPHDPRLRSFVDEYAACLTDRGLQWAGIREVANVVHAIGKMQLKDSAAELILEFVSKEENSRKIVQEGNTLEVGCVAWAFATLGVPSPELFAEIEKRADWLVKEGNSQTVSNVQWSFTTLGVPSPKLLAEIERRAKSMEEKSVSVSLNKDIVNCGNEGKWKDILQLFVTNKTRFDGVNWATAFSQLGRIRNLDRRDLLFASFVNEYADCLQDRGLEYAGIRGVSNVVHIIGKMQLKNSGTKSILELVAKKENASKIVQEGKPQEVSIVAWAFATLDLPSPNLFNEIENRAGWLMTKGSTQHVATIAWASAKLEVKAPKLFAEIDARADWLVENGNTQDVANTAWAFGRLGIKSPKLFFAIERRAALLVQEGNPQEVANIAWACETLGVESPQLFDAIANRTDFG